MLLTPYFEIQATPVQNQAFAPYQLYGKKLEALGLAIDEFRSPHDDWSVLSVYHTERDNNSNDSSIVRVGVTSHSAREVREEFRGSGKSHKDGLKIIQNALERYYPDHEGVFDKLRLEVERESNFLPTPSLITKVKEGFKFVF